MTGLWLQGLQVAEAMVEGLMPNDIILGKSCATVLQQPALSPACTTYMNEPYINRNID